MSVGSGLGCSLLPPPRDIFIPHRLPLQFTTEVCKAQRGKGTCSRSHRMLVVKHRPESRAPKSQCCESHDADSRPLEDGRASDLPVSEMGMVLSCYEQLSLSTHCLNVTRCLHRQPRHSKAGVLRWCQVLSPGGGESPLLFRLRPGGHVSPGHPLRPVPRAGGWLWEPSSKLPPLSLSVLSPCLA